jgi:hypothetical protein
VTSKAKVVALSVGSILVALAIVFLVVVPAITKKVEKEGTAKVAARYAKEDIVLEDALANNFGLESLGATQTRGNGALVLTKKVLHFFQAVPAREVEIPLDRIDEVKIVTSHLGKSVAQDLLHVTFRDPAGKRDAIAWFVRPSAQAWQAKLRELTGK